MYSDPTFFLSGSYSIKKVSENAVKCLLSVMYWESIILYYKLNDYKIKITARPNWENECFGSLKEIVIKDRIT